MLACAFRHCMTAGQSLQGPNGYLRSFFKQIIDIVTEASSSCPLPSAMMTPFKYLRNCVQVPGSEKDGGPVFKHRNGVKIAGTKLCQFVDPNKLLDSTKGPRHPLLILAFDESHTLMGIPRDQSWSVFSELCRTGPGADILPIPIYPNSRNASSILPFPTATV